MRKPLLLASMLTLVALAGCVEYVEQPTGTGAGENPTRVRDPFRLTMLVLGAADPPQPVAGASVSLVNEGGTAVAAGTTGPDGKVLLQVARDQTLRAIGTGNGWTSERTAEIYVADEPRFYMDPLEKGDGHATISMYLFHAKLERAFNLTVGPGAETPPVSDGTGPWTAKAVPTFGDPTIHDLYMDRFRGATASVTWSNRIAEGGDFEVGVACGSSTSPAGHSDGGPYPQPGGHTVELEWTRPGHRSVGTGDPCDEFYAGPVLDTATIGATVHVNVELRFVADERL